MATVRYTIQGKSERVQINLKFSASRKMRFSRLIGKTVRREDWSSKRSFPILRNSILKKLKSNLVDLENYILNEFDMDYAKGIGIDAKWLELKIATFYNRIEPEKSDFLLEYYIEYVKTLPFKVIDRTGEPYAKNTIKSYKSFISTIERFEKYRGKKILIADVDLSFRDEFIQYMMQIEGKKLTTIGRLIPRIKTVCLDAARNKKKINTEIKDKKWKGFEPKAPFQILSFKEIEQIKKTRFLNEKLQIARDWLIISCFTAQRVSDFMKMNKEKIVKKGKYRFVELIQKKTGEPILIPIHPEVQTILDKREGDFPPLYSKNIESNSTQYNRYIKQVAKASGINEIVEEYGKKYEKWELIKSHIGRRSFCSNYYGLKEYPTVVLMAITGHSTERQFLNYIGKKKSSHSILLAETWASETIEDEKNMDPKKQIIS